MTDEEFEKKEIEIIKLGKKAFEAEKELSLYVQGVVIEYKLENDPVRLKELIDLLPGCLFQKDMHAIYCEVKKNHDGTMAF